MLFLELKIKMKVSPFKELMTKSLSYTDIGKYVFVCVLPKDWNLTFKAIPMIFVFGKKALRENVFPFSANTRMECWLLISRWIIH